MTARYRVQGQPRLLAIGRSLAHRSHRDRVLDCWVLGFLTAGRLALAVGTDQTVLRPGDYYLLPPGIRHYGLEPDRHDVAWIEFAAGGGASQAAGALPSFGPGIEGVDPLAVHSLLHEEHLLGRLSQHAAAAQISAWLHLLALSAARRHHRDQDPQRALAARIMRFLQRQVELPLTRADLQRTFHFSPTHLNRAFRAQYGTSILQYFAILRMRYARELLAEGITIKAVAERLGFKDLSYFHRTYKRCLGHTPGSDAG